MTPLFTRLNPKIGIFSSSSNAHVSFIFVISLLLVDILYLLSCFRIILYLIQTTTGSRFVQNVVAIH